MVSMLFPLYQGILCILVSSCSRPVTFYTTMKDQDVTAAYIVALMALALPDLGAMVKAMNLKSLRWSMSAAAPMGKHWWRGCGELWD